MDIKTILKTAALYAVALVLTLIIKVLFGLGFAPGLMVFFALLLLGWKLAHSHLTTKPDEASPDSTKD